MKTCHLIFVVSLFLFSPAVYSAIPKVNYLSEKKISDQQLKDLAIEKLLIPYNADKAYFDSEAAQKNTIALWVLMGRKQKLELIEALKQRFAEDKVVIKLPASYYADEMNGVLYNSLYEEDNVLVDKRKGLGVVFKTIALMDGDFDNGKSMTATLEGYAGEEIFAYFKVSYPDKYQKLIELDKARGR